MSEFTTDVIRKIFDNNSGTAFTIRPDADGLDLVQLEAEDPSHYMIFRPEEARKIAAALVACADEMEARSE